MFYPPGKLPNAALAELLARGERVRRDPRVLVGPQVGEDAAVLDMNGTCLVVATDPITFATENLGWYAVQVNANDVAVRGARPLWFLAVALLPEKRTDDRLVNQIFEQIYGACDEIGCVLVGGHTEITLGLERPMVVGQMIGQVERERLVTTGGAQVGDTLLLTKGIAIEGTALIAREREAQLVACGIPPEHVNRAKELLFNPGIGVAKEALLANRDVHVHAMHDPTEGGLATGIAEMALAARVGVTIQEQAIPILAETAEICAAVGINPLGTLASGALLLAVAPSDAATVIEALNSEHIRCAEIGRVVLPHQGLALQTSEGVIPLPTFARDELVAALESVTWPHTRPRDV